MLSKTNQRKGFLFLSCAVALSITLPAAFNSVTSILLVLFWLFFLPKKIDRERLKKMVFISSLVWVAMLGMIYTQNISEGMFRLQQKSLLLAYPLVFGTIEFEWRVERGWIACAFLIGIFVACGVGFINGLFYGLHHQNTAHLFSHGFADQLDFYPYILSLCCLAAIIILAEAQFDSIELPLAFRKRSMAFALILFFSTFLFLLSVIQILLAWVFIIILYSFKASRNRKFFVGSVFSIVSIVALFVFFVPTLNEKVTDLLVGKQNTIPLDKDASLGFPWNGIAVRKAVWTCAWGVVQANPSFGVGTGDGQDELQKAYEHRQFYFASRYNRFNAHNQYLQVIVNFGFVGLMVWLASLFFLFKMMKTNRLGQCLLAVCLFAMLTESMLETNKGILAMAFLISLFSFSHNINSVE